MTFGAGRAAPRHAPWAAKEALQLRDADVQPVRDVGEWHDLHRHVSSAPIIELAHPTDHSSEEAPRAGHRAGRQARAPTRRRAEPRRLQRAARRESPLEEVGEPDPDPEVEAKWERPPHRPARHVGTEPLHVGGAGRIARVATTARRSPPRPISAGRTLSCGLATPLRERGVKAASVTADASGQVSTTFAARAASPQVLREAGCICCSVNTSPALP